MDLRKADDPIIDPASPWANDDLGRQKEGELLVRLVNSLSGSYVISVKGKWGSGKTVFLRRLAAQLELSGIPAISIDAWRTDYLEDPLIAFTAATEERISKKDPVSGARRAKGRAIATALARHSAVLASPLISTAIDSIAPGMGAAASAATNSAVDIGRDVLNAARTQKAAEQKFRESLAAARDHLTDRDPSRPPGRIVVVIDELDRCRPDYAIKVLERIKHFFDVVGVIFLIATDGENLPNAVASVYGEKISGEVYLRKFFDYEFSLIDPSPERFSHALVSQFGFDDLVASSTFSRKQLEEMWKDPENGYYAQATAQRDRGLDTFEIAQAFPTVAAKLGLSLRDQAQAFTIANAYIRTLNRQSVILPPVAALIFCLRFGHHDLFEGLRAGRISISAIMDLHNERLRVTAGDAWLAKSAPGLELSYYAAAMKESDPSAYIQNAVAGANSNAPFDPVRVAAATRALHRIRAGAKVKEYATRVISLADAFS